MADLGGKRLTFDTIFNVRDLGGYETAAGTTKERRLLRSGDTMFLSDDELGQLIDYGVRRVADLRMAVERPDLSDRFAHVEGVAWANVAMADDRTMTPEWTQSGRVVDFVVEGYLRMLADREGLRRLISFLAAADMDDCVLFHCAGGMDRTGVCSMLVLGAAEASREVMVWDYACAFGTDEEVEEAMGSWDPLAPAPPHDGLPARVCAMHRLLDTIEREHRSVRGYLAHCGVSGTLVDELASHMLG